VKAGAKVAFLNRVNTSISFPVAAYGLVEGDLVSELSAIVRAAAAAANKRSLPGVRAGDGHRRVTGAVAAVLTAGTRRAIILGTSRRQRHRLF